MRGGGATLPADIAGGVVPLDAKRPGGVSGRHREGDASVNVTAGSLFLSLPICWVAGFPVNASRSTSREAWKRLHRQLRVARHSIERYYQVNPPLVEI